MNNKKIVLFDGVCNFCNYWVRFIFKNNKNKDIHFMSLQDERSTSLLPDGFNTDKLISVVYFRKGEVFTHSTAALKIMKELNFALKILSNLAMVIPVKIRDCIYNFIGNRRYTWFGKSENCPIPSPELRKQFI